MRKRRSRVIALALGCVMLTGSAVPASASGGIGWTAPVPVGPLSRQTCGGALAATSTAIGQSLNAVYVSVNGNTYGDEKVFFRRSRDGGATWPFSATLTANPSVWKECPVIAGSGPLLVTAWRQGTNTAAAIRYRVSTNGGATWRAEARLPAPRTPGKPSVAVAGSTIAIGWTDGTGSARWSRVAISHDRAASWAIRALDAKPTFSDGFSRPTTQVAASGNRVFAAWLRSGGTQLVGRVSTDAGRSWAPPAVLAATFTPVPTPYSAIPSRTDFGIAARPDRMAIVWTGGWPETPGEPEMFVRVYAGGAWLAPRTITASSGSSGSPYGYLFSPAVTLLASSRVGIAAAVCTDFTAIDPIYGCGEPYGGSFHVLWTETTDNGAVWTAPLDATGSLTWIGWGVSAIWTSSTMRGLLVSWANGEPDWVTQNLFWRGSDLP